MCLIYILLGDSTVINIEADVNGPAAFGGVDIPDVVPLQPGTSAQQTTDAAKISKNKSEKNDVISVQGVQGGDSNVVVIPKSTAAPSIGRQSSKAHTLSAATQVHVKMYQSHCVLSGCPDRY